MKSYNPDIILHVAFDLDGVLIDSLQSMSNSWNETMKKLNLNYQFNEFKKYIGYPFFKVLLFLKIPKKYHEKIYNIYKEYSLLNIKYIKKYKYVSSSLKKLKEKNIKISIVTSKNKLATNIIVKKFFNKELFDSIITYEDVIKGRGKPNAYPLIQSCYNVNIKPSNTIYIGDMNVDYETSKNAGVQFIFARWGYGKKSNNHLQISNIKELIEYINK